MSDVKRSEVYFHDGNLFTLEKGLGQTSKKYYARDDLDSRLVYALQENCNGVPICRVHELQDDRVNTWTPKMASRLPDDIPYPEVLQEWPDAPAVQPIKGPNIFAKPRNPEPKPHA